MVLTINAKLVGDIPSDDIAIVKNEETKKVKISFQ